MKRMVYRMHRVGSLDRLILSEEELSSPQPDEITVEIKAIGLNFADFFCIHGLYKAAPKYNLIPGLEFSGIVIDKGSEVNDFSVGDKVIGVTKFGAFTTHINLNKMYLIKLPEDWSFEEGASFVVQALTAYYALKELGNIKQNQIVLIHSVAGGVGIYANRIAKKFNCTTIGTVGSAGKIEKIKNEQVDSILVRDKNFIKALKEILNNKKIDLLLESLTGKYFKHTFELLAPQGRAIIYGASNFATHTAFPNYFELAYKYFTRPKVNILKLIEQNKSVMGFNLIWLYEKGDYLKSLLNEIIELQLPKPYIGEIFSFDQMPQAIKKFQTGRTFGKVVVIVN